MCVCLSVCARFLTKLLNRFWQMMALWNRMDPGDDMTGPDFWISIPKVAEKADPESKMRFLTKLLNRFWQMMALWNRWDQGDVIGTLKFWKSDPKLAKKAREGKNPEKSKRQGKQLFFFYRTSTQPIMTNDGSIKLLLPKLYCDWPWFVKNPIQSGLKGFKTGDNLHRRSVRGCHGRQITYIGEASGACSTFATGWPAFWRTLPQWIWGFYSFHFSWPLFTHVAGVLILKKNPCHGRQLTYTGEVSGACSTFATGWFAFWLTHP